MTKLTRAIARRAKWLLFLGLALPARAHDGAITPANPLSVWATEPNVVLPVLLLGWAYAIGWLRVRARHPSPKRGYEAAAFWAGWLALAAALISPVHPLGSVLFSAHMIQHELLMVVAAPLIVLGRAELFAVCALPRRAAGRVSRAFRRAGATRAWHFIADPLVATALHAFALWIWHAPRWFEATLASSTVHAAQHLSFFGSALLFWHAVLRGSRTRASYGLGVAMLFLTGMQTGALGALLTFSSRPWYPVYTPSVAAWGLTPLEDQQLGGIIMWVPGGLAYIIAGLILFAKWLHAAPAASRIDHASASIFGRG